MSTPAERLKQARIRAGFKSATAAAKAFGWTESTYLGHENGSRGLPVDAAQRYGRAFRVPWEFLLSGATRVSAAEYGTPIVGTLGFAGEPILPRDDANIVPVGAEGYDFSELAAFVAGLGDEVHYLIVSILPDQPILVGDEIVIGTDTPAGRLLTSWTVSQSRAGATSYYERIGRREHGEMLTSQEFQSLPGLSVEGVVVATYVDKRRRKAIEAAG